MAGLEAPDDAAVWRIDEERSVVVTNDFFTPVVDDPYDYGAISAANSLSDIYAMGGQPFLALNISALPPQLPVEIGSQIMLGGAEKAKEAGVVVAGGHTIQDKEPKYGLVALGFVSNERFLTKRGLQPGDQLMLSKPLGSGTISTAIMKDIISEADAQLVISWMKRLNRDASALALEFSAKSATDITGFGFLGHAWEMASASKTGLRFYYSKMPFFEGVESLAAKWCFPGGAFNNMEFYQPHIRFAEALTQEQQMLLFDPQTSGGLLFGIPAEKADACLAEAVRRQVPLWRIGTVTETGIIEVV